MKYVLLLAVLCGCAPRYHVTVPPQLIDKDTTAVDPIELEYVWYDREVIIVFEKPPDGTVKVYFMSLSDGANAVIAQKNATDAAVNGITSAVDAYLKSKGL